MRAFLMMPFAAELDWLYKLVVAAGETVGVEVRRADDIFRAGVVIDQIKEELATADAVVAVCTGKNASVFYELGMSDARHRPILIAAETADLPFDIKHYRALLYGYEESGQDKATLLDRTAQALTETINAREVDRPTVLAVAPAPARQPKLKASLTRDGNRYLFAVTNVGNVVLHNITWEIPEDAHWVSLGHAPEYPIAELAPGESASILIYLVAGSEHATTVGLGGETADGEPYSREQPVTSWG